MIESFELIGQEKKRIQLAKIKIAGRETEYTYKFVVLGTEIYLSAYIWTERGKMSIKFLGTEEFIINVILEIKKLDFVRVRNLYKSYDFKIDYGEFKWIS